MRPTIVRLGDHDMAGSRDYPVTYRIRACPKCYGVLFWKSKGQTKIRCEQCDTTIYIRDYGGPINYIRHMLRTIPLSRETVLYALYAVCQVLDQRLRLRKILLYMFIRGVSYL
jgi:ribosomal protein S27E